MTRSSGSSPDFERVDKDAGGQHFQIVQGGAAIGEFRRDDFALLGHPHAAVDGAGRLGGDGAAGGRAAAAHRAAAAMEEADRDARLAADTHQPALGLEQFEAGAEEAAILVAVGIAQHDFLTAADVARRNFVPPVPPAVPS